MAPCCVDIGKQELPIGRWYTQALAANAIPWAMVTRGRTTLINWSRSCIQHRLQPVKLNGRQSCQCGAAAMLWKWYCFSRIYLYHLVGYRHRSVVKKISKNMHRDFLGTLVTVHDLEESSFSFNATVEIHLIVNTWFQIIVHDVLHFFRDIYYAEV